MKKIIRLTESDLTRIVQRVINEGKKKIKIPREYSGVITKLGKSSTPEEIISAYNTTVFEETRLVSYSDGVFYNEEEDEIPVDVVLDELNYAIASEDNLEIDDEMRDALFGIDKRKGKK